MGFLANFLSSLISPKRPGGTASTGGVRMQFSIEENTNRFASADERRDYLNQVRRDPAAKAWRRAPQAFSPIAELSYDPVCPYCGSSLGERKRPTRRSKLTCKSCKNMVYVDAWHRIFPSCYLNAKQGLVARYLGRLNDMPGVAGTSKDFWWFAQQKDWTRGKCPLSDQGAGDVIWGLMNYSVVEMRNMLPPEEMSQFQMHAQVLQDLLKSYRQEEKALKTVHQKMRAAETAKIELICPNCGESVGLVKQPTRRSSRKCKLCGKTIFVDPKQELFKGCFLTDRQAFLVDTLAEIGHRVTMKGSIQDYHRTKRALGLNGDLDNHQIAKVLRAMAIENAKRAKKAADKQQAKDEKLFGMRIGSPDYSDVEYVMEILRDIDTTVAEWK